MGYVNTTSKPAESEKDVGQINNDLKTTQYMMEIKRVENQEL
jgi:hypothetical protein